MAYLAAPRSDDRLGDLTPRQEQRLKELAKWPHDAHRAWRKLDALERNLVVWQMAAKYGQEFAKQFLAHAGKPKTDDDLLRHYFGRGVGPTSATIRARGMRLAQKDSIHEWWVHPDGRSIARNHLDDAPTPRRRRRGRNQRHASRSRRSRTRSARTKTASASSRTS